MSMARRALACPAVFLALALVAALPMDAQAQKATISVSTAEDFVRALGSDRTVFLQRGDFLLSLAYDVDNPDVEWRDSAFGKELVLKDVHDLVIRGVAGSRIIVDSPSAYFLAITSAADLQIDNVAFARKVAPGLPGPGGAAGGLYLQDCRNTRIDRCSFEGPNDYPIELAGCGEVRIARCRLSDGYNGAVSVLSCTGITFEDCSVLGNAGGPLLAVSDSSAVSFQSCLFKDNEGGIFIDIGGGADWNIGFDSCTFRGNHFDYFARDGFLPSTYSCTFVENSFGEDWVDLALAPSGVRDALAGTAPSLLLSYAFAGTGLGVRYPSGWDVDEGPGNGRVGLFSPLGLSFLIFTPLDAKLPPGARAGAAAALQKAFETAAASFCQAMHDDSGLTVSIAAESLPAVGAAGLLGASWTGTVSKPGGIEARVLVRFLALESRIYALAAFSSDPLELIEGGGAAGILLSFGPAR